MYLFYIYLFFSIVLNHPIFVALPDIFGYLIQLDPLIAIFVILGKNSHIIGTKYTVSTLVTLRKLIV